MANLLFKKVIESLHEDLIRAFNRTKNFPSPVSGREREIFVEYVPSRILPNSFRFGSGIIIDSTGDRQTNQIDLVIERPYSASFPIGVSSQRLYVAETVAAAFEIKSDLSKQWEGAKESALSVLRMQMLLEDDLLEKSEDMVFGHVYDHRVPMFLVGFTGYKSCDSLAERLGDYILKGIIRGAFIVDSGVFIGTVGSIKKSTTVTEASGSSGLAAFLTVLLETILTHPHREPQIRRYI